MRRWLALATIVATACTSTAQDTTTTSSAAPTTTGSQPTSTTTSPPTTSSTVPTSTTTTIAPDDLAIEAFAVPSGSRPHDVAPAADGGVWYTAQNSGELGWLDPTTGEVFHVALGPGSRPHGVIVDEAGTPWVTDGGLNAIVSVDPASHTVSVFPLPDTASDANLNTAAFDGAGTLWFTGQNGIYGKLETDTGAIEVYEAPRGSGPYGITSTPTGNVAYASLAGSYVGLVLDGGTVEILGPPTPDQGSRRVWSDSEGNLWVAEWNTGHVSRYSTGTGDWTSWPLPGPDPAAYAVYVDEHDIVWLTDFGADSIVRFDPTTESFTTLPLPHAGGNVRQLLGRPGEIWGAESAADHLIVIRTR